MFEILRRLALGIALIALAAGVLLYTDRGSRNRSRKASSAPGQTAKVLRVALVQHASLNVLEQGAEGVLDALAERGVLDGEISGRRVDRRARATLAVGLVSDVELYRRGLERRRLRDGGADGNQEVCRNNWSHRGDYKTRVRGVCVKNSQHVENRVTRCHRIAA